MATTVYHDFLLVANTVTPQTFTVQVFDSPVGQGEPVEAVTIPDHLPALLDALYAHQMDGDLPRQIELGELLAGLLLPPYARRMFTASLSRLQSGEGLRLRLRLADALAAYPWEFAFLQELRGERTPSSFLALDTRLSIVRDLPLPFPPDEDDDPPQTRRILVVMASPTGLPALPGLPAEAAALRAALFPVPGLEAEYLPDYDAAAITRTTPQRLADALQLRPRTDIFHFSGHGVFRTAANAPGMGFLALEDDAGGLSALPADRLCELLRSHGVRLVFLNACQSAQRDPVGLWNSLAAAMLKARIPAVVAMGAKIRDDLAAAFSAAFYRALVAGFPLDYAAAVGRLAIRNADQGGSAGGAVDWGVPVLYARSGARPLFAPVQDANARRQAERELPAYPAVQVNQQIGYVSGQVIGEFHGDIGSLTFFESDSSRPPRPSDEAQPPAERRCRSCNSLLRPAARFCPQCGAPTAGS